MLKKKRRAQSILEYTIILAAIIAAVIAGATKMVQPAVTQGLEDSQYTMEKSTGQLRTLVGEAADVSQP